MPVVWRIKKETVTILPNHPWKRRHTETLPTVFRSKLDADNYVEQQVRAGIALWNELQRAYPHMMEPELPYVERITFYPTFPTQPNGPSGGVTFVVFSEFVV